MMIMIATQTSFFRYYPLHYLQPDILLVGVIWCALKRAFTEGGILTLVMAEITELHSGAPQGLFLALYLTVFLIVRISSRIFVVSNRIEITYLTLAAAILVKVLQPLLHSALAINNQNFGHFAIFLLLGSASTSLLGYGLYPFFAKLDWLTFKNRKAETMLADEVRIEGSEI